MAQHRPVPGIARQPQQFQMPQPQHQQYVWPQTPPPAAAQADYGVEQQLQELALEIYSTLAAEHIRSGKCDRDELEGIATNAQTAARSYFEALGVRFNG